MGKWEEGSKLQSLKKLFDEDKDTLIKQEQDRQNNSKGDGRTARIKRAALKAKQEKEKEKKGE